MLEDRALESLQLVAELEPELLIEVLARVAVRSERLDLAAAAVERQHQQRAEALEHRLLLHQRLELGDQLAVASELEIGPDPTFERGEAELVEARDLRPEHHLAEFRERRAPPERERLAQERCADREVGCSRLGDEALEHLEVELVGPDDRHVPRRLGDDDLLP